MSTEDIHEFGSGEDWIENFYFNFYDRGQDICGFMHVGLMPNKKLKEILCYLIMPDGHIYGHVGHVPMENNDLEGLGLKLTKVEDEKSWKLTFDGELPDVHKEGAKEKALFELNWTSLNPVYDYKESAGDKAAQGGGENISQYGKVTGKIHIGTKIYDVTALGDRDHSWGLRDLSGPWRWLWATAQFDENFALGISKVWVDERTVVDGGYLSDEGKNRAIVRSDMVVEETERGSPSYVYMAVYDKDGEVLGVKAKVEHCAQLVVPGKEGKAGTKVQHCLSRFTVSDGDDVGFGIVEYVHRRR
ncbi:MAG TPA: hypothetical protein VEH08_02210 [Methanomassiliicoccales archaeon]|nr:hypothetical protein [Methanomassiliicoccales archaeon]